MRNAARFDNKQKSQYCGIGRARAGMWSRHRSRNADASWRYREVIHDLTLGPQKMKITLTLSPHDEGISRYAKSIHWFVSSFLTLARRESEG
jgi:hypothetical protein